MASQNVVTITDSNFEQEVIQSSQPVLVDFWAEWCGPCKMIAPVLDEIADEKAGAVKIAKVDVDHNQALSARFGIRAIPTLLLFKNGAVQDQMVGMTSKRDLVSKIDALS
jgi:thioredoxin 1